MCYATILLVTSILSSRLPLRVSASASSVTVASSLAAVGQVPTIVAAKVVLCNTIFTEGQQQQQQQQQPQ
jgi:hypothetical protein